MKYRLLAIAALALACVSARGQMPNFGDIPVEINAENQRFVNGVAVAEGNVEIVYGPTTIYADYGQYNPDTRDVLVTGNVRIYREGRTFLSERAVYNLETKQLHASDVRGEFYPFEFSSDALVTISGGFQANDAMLTTSDSEKPDYQIRAKTIRIYPKDRIVMSNVTVYAGKLPVFWYPYIYQSLDKQQSFTYTPGYDSTWGAFLLTQYTFPISEHITGQVRLDLRSSRGAAIGFNSEFKFGPEDRNWGSFRSYYLDDLSTTINKTALARQTVDSQRYRISLQERVYLTDDIYANIDINKLSDPLILQDFFTQENRLDPQPDSMISLTKLSEDYTLTGIIRKQINSFQDTTERLPDFEWDIKRHAIFDSPVFYESESSLANLTRAYPFGYAFPDYSAVRLDSFHQLLLPQTFFDWLSVIPRAGARFTYYSASGGLVNQTVQDPLFVPLTDGLVTPVQQGQVRASHLVTEFEPHGGLARVVFDAGVEASFKLSRTYDVESRMWGLDGLRHVLQPYTDFSWVTTNQDPSRILQFDRYGPSDQLPAIDFPDFNSIDSITNWTIWRFGLRNRLETRRDGRTFTWLETDTFVDWNLHPPNYPGLGPTGGGLSNIENTIRFSPVPWVSLQADAQLPIGTHSFSEFNTSVNVLANQDLRFTVGQRYIHGNPYFVDSSLFTVGSYYRIDDNWSVSFRDEYEMATRTFQYQDYEVHRDLSSWIASFGLLFRNNRVVSGGPGVTSYGFIFTLTLKDLPQFNVPFGLSPDTSGSVKGK